MMLPAVHGGLVRFGFQQLRHTKKMKWALVVSFVPFLAGILQIINEMYNPSTGPQGTWTIRLGEWTSFMVLGATVPFVSLLLASGLLADEAEERTLSYLLVRPIGRRSLYLSRLIPVAAAASALAMLQVVLLSFAQFLSYLFTAAGANVLSWDGDATMSGGVAIISIAPVALVVAAVTGVLFTALFGFISLLSTRYHVYISIGLFVAWELPFGASMGGGLGYFTVLYHANSVVFWADPTAYSKDLANPLFALPWLAAWTAIWVWLALRRVARQDFNVTSAAT